MSDDPMEPAPQPERLPEGWPSAYPPPPSYYQPSASGPPVSAPPATYPPPVEQTQPGQPTWAGQADVYPPPPEVYLERAKAAPTFVTPGYTSGYAPAPPRAEPQRRARRWRRSLYPHQPITELDVALLVISAAVSFALYAVILGWQVGLGLTLLIFAHEMGHFVVIRAKGLPVRLPIFIPLVGAFVLMGQGPMDARDEAEIALAGPFAGMLGSIVCLVAYWFTRQPALLSVATINLGINLFNLLPIGPLDGARASRAISKWLLLPGLALLAVSGLCTFDILITVLSIAAIIQVVMRDNDPIMVCYARTPRRQRIYVTLLYFGLMATMIITLVVGTFGMYWLPLLRQSSL